MELKSTLHRPVPSEDTDQDLVVDAGSEREQRTRALFAQVEREGCPDRRRRLRDQAILVNRCLAIGVSKRYRGRGVDSEDIEQVAMLGLCKAASGYQPRPGSTFAAYAVPTISGEVKRYFRDHAWLIRPTRSVQELAWAVRSASSELAQSLGREPTTGDVAQALDVSEGDLAEARLANASYHARALDAPVGETGLSMHEVLADERDDIAIVDDIVSLRAAIAQLPPRERTILHLRFVEDQTQEQIGQALGISQMHVSRLLRRIATRLASCTELKAS